jgi:hypothetical protein
MLLLERFPTNNTSDGDIGGIDQQNATAEFTTAMWCGCAELTSTLMALGMLRLV